MSDLASLDTSSVLGRAERLAQEDPQRESEERWSIVVELHRRGGSPVYQAAKGEKLSNVVDRPRELGGVLLRLSSSVLRFLLHAVDEVHAGAHERQELRAIHLSPALFRPREQLERHHQRLRA